MPPSIFNSEALVIWMFRIAMNAPIMAAITEIQTTALARPGAAGITADVTLRRGAAAGGIESARSDMASPLCLPGHHLFDVTSLRRAAPRWWAYWDAAQSQTAAGASASEWWGSPTFPDEARRSMHPARS